MSEEPEKFNLKIADFEGPLDLLLHLIKSSKIDIYDIPIVDITAQYLDYLTEMKQLQFDIAGEYLVMAANLMVIKSKMLLPKAIIEDPEENEDPREDLVQQLLTYQTFQAAANSLLRLSQTRQNLWSKKPTLRPVSIDQVRLDHPIMAISYLKQAYEQVQIRTNEENHLTEIEPNEDYVSIDEKADQICQILARTASHKATFTSLLPEKPKKEEVVTTFLALLELMKKKQIYSWQDGFFTPIHTELRTES